MPQVLLWGQSTAQHPHWGIPWSSLSWGSGLQQGQLGIHRVLQELLTLKLLELPTIPSGTALVSSLPLLLSALFPFLVSALSSPPCTLAGKKLLVQQHLTIWEERMALTEADSLPQELEIFPWHMGLWYGEHRVRWGVKRQLISNGGFWCLLEVCT